MPISRIVNPFIEFNGLRYYRDKQGWRASACKGHERLARAVWRHHHGDIPSSHYVAAKDGDNWNSDISNLELRRKGNESLAKAQRSARWTAERERKLRALHAMGLSQSAIGRALGVPQGTLSHKCRSLDRGTRHFWTEENLAEFRARIAAGQSAAEIADAMGCKKAAVYQRAAREKLAFRPRFWTDERVERLKALFASGLSISQVAKEMGCGRQAAWAKHKRVKVAEARA